MSGRPPHSRAQRRQMKRRAKAPLAITLAFGAYSTLQDGRVVRITHPLAKEALKRGFEAYFKSGGRHVLSLLTEDEGMAFPEAIERRPGTERCWLLCEMDRDTRLSCHTLWVGGKLDREAEARAVLDRLRAHREEAFTCGFPARAPQPRPALC